MLKWEFLHPQATMYHLGYIGAGLSEKNPKSAREQINDLYPYGGWRCFINMAEVKHLGNNVYKYPGDPPQRPIARAKLRDETICVYDHEFWGIFQPDGSFELARLD